MGIHKECIANAIKFESDFKGGQNGCAGVDMGEQQYDLQLHIAFVPPRKPGCSPMHPINSTHGDIAVSDRQYQNNLHDYHTFKNMNSALKKIVFAAIYEQWIKGAKDMVMGCAKKSFVELMEWLYVRYGKIMPGEIMQNQDKMQATYNV